MPIYEFKCKAGHVTEKIMLTPQQRKVDTIPCPSCDERAYIIFSRTGAPVLKEGSGGFYKPSAE